MDDNKIILIQQDIQNIKEIIKELKDTTKNHDERIIELEKSEITTEMQFEQIMTLLNKLNNETIPSLIKEVEELKNKPIKRYDQAITGILGAIFGAVGGAIAGLFLKK